MEVSVHMSRLTINSMKQSALSPSCHKNSQRGTPPSDIDNFTFLTSHPPKMPTIDVDETLGPLRRNFCAENKGICEKLSPSLKNSAVKQYEK